MRHVFTADICSIAVLLVILTGLIRKRGTNRCARAFSSLCIAAIIGTLLDAITDITVVNPLPALGLKIIWALSYSSGMVALIFFVAYWYTYIIEKTTINKLFWQIPAAILTACAIFTFVYGMAGQIFTIENGKVIDVGEMPKGIALVEMLIIVFLPVIAAVRKKEIGLKAILLLGSFGLLPLIANLLTMYTNLEDYTFPCGALSLLIMYVYLETRLEEDKEKQRQQDLIAKNEEQEAQIEEIRALNTQLEENQSHLEESTAHQEEQIAEITELNSALEDQMSIIRSITRVYYAAYYINLNDNSFMELATKQGIRNIVGSKGDAQKQLYVMSEKLVLPEHSAPMREFVELSTINDRLHDRQFITLDYEGALSGWSQAFFIAGDRDDDGRFSEVIFATRTIHDEKRRELDILEKIEKAKETAEDANNAKTAFLFNMSHDIRTPMNAIIGFRDLLEKNQDNPEKRADYLRKIDEASSVLLSIINNVLEMARIEKGTIELEEVVWSAEQFNDTIYSVFLEMMEEKKIEFTREIKVQNQFVVCDAIKLREVFYNILSNAYKYTNPKGKVSMMVEEEPCARPGYTTYKTTISDTGIGMSEEFLPHIFEEFSRESNYTSNKIEGTGLGMPIVKRLIELMGGTIDIKSTKGVGTTIIVRIPHRIADKKDMVDRSDIAYDPEIFKGKRILLAEDNELNAEIAMEILAEVGFLVERAEDGLVCVDMLSKAADQYYNLVLMDIQMPNLNGYDTTREIRKMGNIEKASIPIIAMTANAFEEDKREAFKAGMNGHLAKPVNVKELLKELARFLG